MPSMEASRNASLDGYTPVAARPALPPLVPPLPIDLRPSPVMISSLPGIATNVDGITRQFNGRNTVPVRRLVSPT